MAMNQTELAERVAESYVPDRTDAVRQLFNDAGARAPDVIWSPGTNELRNPLLRSFEEKCRSLATDGRLRKADFDLGDFGGLAGWLMLLEPVENGEDFQYLSYGASIAESFGTDMTGKRTSAFGGHISTFFLGLYRAVLRRREWVYSEHEPPKEVFVRLWQRLIVPVFDDDGLVSHILVLNVPDNELRAGLELMVDPVFVLRADETVVYYNRAAQTLFHIRADNPRRSLEDLTGIPLETVHSPEAMLSQQKIEDSVRLTLRETIVERLVMTVSATQHRDEAFYVVVMRLIGT